MNNRGGRFGSNFSGHRLTCQICRQNDHEAAECPHHMNPQFGSQTSQSAMCANAASSSATPTCLLDSSASSHMTNSVANLQSSEPYTGSEQVYISDGKGLHILNSGSSTLSTTQHNFAFRNVLHVPGLKQDLLSANQFTIDN
ncbi:hypothetical protein ACFX2A_000367 [Malus domestica]